MLGGRVDWVISLPAKTMDALHELKKTIALFPRGQECALLCMAGACLQKGQGKNLRAVPLWGAGKPFLSLCRPVFRPLPCWEGTRSFGQKVFPYGKDGIDIILKFSAPKDFIANLQGKK